MIRRGDQTLSYTPSDKAYLLRSGSEEVRFYYDSEGKRYKKRTNTYNTFYLDNIYERSLYTDENKNTYVGYYYFADRLVAMKRVTGTKQRSRTFYVHTDALGSVCTVTNAGGGIEEQRSYEPFGEIRPLNHHPKNTTTLTNRAFTNHEQIDELDGLIHMGGRVYDSNIGRFTSADIHVPHPYSTQSFNRYAYVRNNPLGFVDPSGYNGISVNAEQAIEHYVQKIKSSPEPLRTEGDHTPRPGKIDSLARMQVRMNHPYLFTEEAKGQLFMIDVEPSFTEAVAEALGIGDTYASLFNDGYNPLSNRFLTPKEQMDTKVLALFSLGLPEVGMLKFSKDVGKIGGKTAEKMMKSKYVGVGSKLFGNSRIRTGKLNSHNSKIPIKIGWSQPEGGGGYLFRIGFGRASRNSNKARWHIEFPSTYLPYSVTDPIIDAGRRFHRRYNK